MTSRASAQSRVHSSGRCGDRPPLGEVRIEVWDAGGTRPYLVGGAGTTNRPDGKYGDKSPHSKSGSACYAFQTWPGLVLQVAMALRVSTMQRDQSASS